MTLNIILIILLAVTVISLLAVLLIFTLNKKVERKSDIHIAGGVNIDTGQFYSDNNYFKGVIGEIEETRVVKYNYRRNNIYEIRLQNIIDNSVAKVSFEETLVLGRQQGYNRFCVNDDPAVSKEHCCLFFYNGVLYVRDLGSRNFTYLNDIKIEDDTVCKSGSILKVGNTVLRIIY